MKRSALVIVASIAALLLAGPPPALALGEEFSAYAVARVKVLDGSVWVRASDGGDWEEFSSNSPIPPRSRVSVPEAAEAELQFHGGQFVLLTPGTDLEVRDLQEGRSTFRLRAGEIRFDLPPDDFAPVFVRLPGGAIARFTEPGRQWLTVIDGDETRLVVRRGSAVVVIDGDEHRLQAGQEAVIGRHVAVARYRGGADASIGPSPPAEGEGSGDLPPVVVSELREYGEWVNVPAYGTVWRPRVATGWSPYVYGRWTWISPYGWTWVSYEPWGWYPYRCGYWVTDPAFGWVWTPHHSFVSVHFIVGSTRYRHHNVTFRPATVRFIPEGRSVRWVPLRPGEQPHSAAYVRGDNRLAGWNRPLESGRVFVRVGPDRREWHDYSAVRAERQMVIRNTRAAQPRTDTRTVRPENRAAPPPARKPAPRPVTREERRNFTPREAVPNARKAEPQAPPPRIAPATRPPVHEKARNPEPKVELVPGKKEMQAPPPRNAPATRPPVREKAREPEPKVVPGPAKKEMQPPPSRGAPATRPPVREKAREPEARVERSGNASDRGGNRDQDRDSGQGGGRGR